MDLFLDTIFRDLEKLNFSFNESKVYLTLLKLGPSMAGKIAKEANLDRTSVYNSLKILLNKGIISYAIEANRKVFRAENPKKILDYYREKEDLTKEIILKLKPFYETKKEKSDVSFYQNPKGLKTVFQDILDLSRGKECLLIGSEGQFSEKMPYYSPLFLKQKEKNKIKTRRLVREGRKIGLKQKNTEYRTIPSNVKSPATITIYNGKVAIFIWSDKPEAILIENKDIFESFRNYFNFMWEHAKN